MPGERRERGSGVRDGRVLLWCRGRSRGAQALVVVADTRRKEIFQGRLLLADESPRRQLALLQHLVDPHHAGRGGQLDGGSRLSAQGLAEHPGRTSLLLETTVTDTRS